MYQTRKHIILWAIIHSLLIDPKKSAKTISGSHTFTHSYAKQKERKRKNNLNTAKQTNANNKRSATKIAGCRKKHKHMRAQTPCLIL